MILTILKLKKLIVNTGMLFRAIAILIIIVFSSTVHAIEAFNQIPIEVQKQMEEEKYKVRIKDIVNFQGIRDNILVGYGLVVGLDGTGDNLRNSTFTQQELESFLGRLGVNTKGANINTKSIAAVTVTATLPPFARTGSKIDVTVSTLGDARSLIGGVLLATPLLGADGEVYALAQGNLLIPNKDSSSVTNSINGRSVFTTGYINNGAIIEREVDFALNSMNTINIGLRNPDISTAMNIASAINEKIQGNLAKAIDPATIKVSVPKNYSDNVLALLNLIENIHIKTDMTAKIIIDSRTGIVILNNNVTISQVAVSYGNLMVQVNNGQNRRQTQGNTNSAILEHTASLKDLIEGLNSLGVEPRELIEILQSMKAIGALHAEIITR